MPTVQIRELPPFRFVCRRVPPTDDIDLILAEAAALMLWARENRCAPARATAWYVLDPDGTDGVLEVAIPVTGDAPQEDGLKIRRAESATCAVGTCGAAPSIARACAARLRDWPGAETGRPIPGAGIWVRLDPAPTSGLAGATLHVPLIEPPRP